jgi:coproporphyrinogen III oxidase
LKQQVLDLQQENIKLKRVNEACMQVDRADTTGSIPASLSEMKGGRGTLIPLDKDSLYDQSFVNVLKDWKATLNNKIEDYVKKRVEAKKPMIAFTLSEAHRVVNPVIPSTALTRRVLEMGQYDIAYGISRCWRLDSRQPRLDSSWKMRMLNWRQPQGTCLPNR